MISSEKPILPAPHAILNTEHSDPQVHLQEPTSCNLGGEIAMDGVPPDAPY